MKSQLLLALCLPVLALGAAADNKPHPVGYDDTPLIPGTSW
ncbi:MAG: hypothetical protein RLZZ447_796, partial [Verrucomicrobiota bacterium]